MNPQRHDQTGERFGDYKPEPRFRGLDERSIYLTMRDGVRLAVDVILPGNLTPQDRLPALLVQSRYWRTIELKLPFKWFMRAEDTNPHFKDQQPFFLSHGYAIISVDVRGTGASFGVWPYPWHADTLEDAREIIDWIISQPWSNGRVGAYGISYLGTTAELLTAIDHPALKAVIPMFNHPDAYTDIAFPGGLFNERFIKSWGYFDEKLDKNLLPEEFGWVGRLLFAGVKPVDEDRDHELLQQAVAEHAANGNSYLMAKSVSCRDDFLPEFGCSIEEMTVHHYLDEVTLSTAATCGWASWMDAGTADAAIRRFMTFENARRAVIGAWEHGGRFNASPYRPVNAPAHPPLPEQWREMLRFFDAYLKDIPDSLREEQTLYYYTMGEEKWKSTLVWPPVGTMMERWYFGREQSLQKSTPGLDDAGEDRYKVDLEAASAENNRWWEMAVIENKTVSYPDRAQQDRRLLTYTSKPLNRDIEITGYPVVTIWLSSTHDDGAVYVYLEDVDERGVVRYVTEGQLRLLHRKISPEEASPYRLLVPYRSFRQADASPLTPGKVEEICFGLQPTSVLIRKGHCLRVAIAGHDAGTFAQLPAQGFPELTVMRRPETASCIDLPVVPRQS